MTKADQAFWAKCPGCGHCWVAAYYPAPLSAFADILRANSKRCPKCGAANAVVAKQTNGVLEEPQP